MISRNAIDFSEMDKILKINFVVSIFYLLVRVNTSSSMSTWLYVSLSKP